MAAIWNGTQQESYELLLAIEHNCVCEFDPMHLMKLSTCAPHKMLTDDQRALDGLLFTRRIVAQLLMQEMEEPCSTD